MLVQMWWVGGHAVGWSAVAVVISIRPASSAWAKVRALPQSPQKPRSPFSDDLKNLRLPFVIKKDSIGNVIQLTNAAPAAFWHIMQWQLLALTAGAVTR